MSAAARRSRARGAAPASARRDVFTALADPTRRRLLDMLRAAELPVHELAGRFDVTRPAISQHLRVLRDAGLVREAKVGRERRYRLRAAALREVYAWVRQYERFWDERLARLGAALDREATRDPGEGRRGRHSP